MDQDSGSGEPQLPVSKAILAVLDRRGVGERQRLTTLRAALGLSYQQVRRRMNGESPWQVDEIKRLAAHFGEPLFGLLSSLVDNGSRRATLRVGKLSLPCTIWLGSPTATAAPGGALVAVAGESTDHWHVVPLAEIGDRQAREITRLIYEAAPARRVAIVDADRKLAAGIAGFLRGKGLEAVTFPKPGGLLAALPGSRFDGFVIAWTPGARPARELLSAVRDRNPEAPVIVLTGPVEAGSAQEAELESTLSACRAQLHEKPARMLSLYTALNRGFESGSRGG